MTETDDTIDVRHLCPLPHRGHAPQITPPATICDHHADTIGDRVTDIRRLWDCLTDLIAELRSEWEMVTVQEAADRAEARLKEVQR